MAVPIVAFANADGGGIAIGVSDKTRKIEGIDQHTEKLNELLRVLLDQVQKGKPIKLLRKRKLIEGRLPHIYVSKNIARVTDQKVEYSKHKGLAEKKCEALLLDSLKDHGNLTKQEIVKLLWDLLPDQLEDKQKMNKIDYLLKRLRVSGIIKNQSKGNASIWMLGKL